MAFPTLYDPNDPDIPAYLKPGPTSLLDPAPTGFPSLLGGSSPAPVTSLAPPDTSPAGLTRTDPATGFPTLLSGGSPAPVTSLAPLDNSPAGLTLADPAKTNFLGALPKLNLPTLATPTDADRYGLTLHNPFTMKLMDPQTAADTAELNRLNATGDGISQIKNPFARGLLRTLDVAGSVFNGTRALEAAIPGTNLHHQLGVQEQQQRVGFDQQMADLRAKLWGTEATTQLTQAQTRNYNADANAKENPAPTYHDVAGPNGQPGQVQDGTNVWRPTIDSRTGQSIPATPPKTEPHYVSNDDGSVVAIAPDANGVLQATKVYQGPPKQQTEITKLEVDGKPHSVVVDKNTGQVVHDMGESGEKPISVSMGNGGTWSMAQMPDGNNGMKTVLFNSKTAQVMDAPEGLAKGSAPTSTGTVADKNRTSLAKIAMNNLDQMQALIQRRPDLLGAISGRFTSLDQMFGSDDPDVVALGSQMHNFAMANAGIHGSRSAENVKAQEMQMLNNFHTGPKGFQGGLDANRQNLKAVIAVTDTPKSQSGAGGQQGQAIPQAAAAQLREGQMHTFNNGQTWTLRSGQPVRVR